jgi:hypothetical protein
VLHGVQAVDPTRPVALLRVVRRNSGRGEF